MTLDELKAAIAADFDEVQLLDFLDIGILELVEILEEQIQEHREDFNNYPQDEQPLTNKHGD